MVMRGGLLSLSAFFRSHGDSVKSLACASGLRHFMVTVADSSRCLCGPPVEAFDVGLSAGHEQHAARGKAPCIRVHLVNHPLHRAVAKGLA
jgi:hypothetical protein